MPVRVVLDHPQRHIFRRLWQKVSMVAGALLLVLGIAASVVAVPANVLAAAWFLGEKVDIEISPGRSVTADEILLVWGISTPLAIFGVSRGLRLVRRGRTMVLFLRRFGHDEAQNAVTFAVTNTIGRSWRVVTLDDAEIEPVGVPYSCASFPPRNSGCGSSSASIWSAPESGSTPRIHRRGSACSIRI
jgi:hypothetical protein